MEQYGEDRGEDHAEKHAEEHRADRPQRPRVVIHAANLHVGGGVQVATSFLEEVARLPLPPFRLEVLASSEVAAGLERLGVDCGRFDGFETLDVHGPWRGMAALRRRLAGADAVFTLFGPSYIVPKPRLSIVGFAQAWILHPDNDAHARLPLPARLRTRLAFLLKELAFRHGSDFVVVEAEHVRAGLIARRLFPADRIAVVPNCIGRIFRQPVKWAGFDMPERRRRWRLGLVSRDYSHKNLDILPAVERILRERHGVEVEFVVTLTEAEWNRRTAEFRRAVCNVGPLDIEQCPSFYAQLDGVIFPSLLECFSATPLEAMVMGKPLFASDRPFVRDLCGDVPYYFDPLSPEDAARVIAGYFSSGGDEARLEAGRRQVLAMPGARDRATAYLSLIETLLAGQRRPRPIP